MSDISVTDADDVEHLARTVGLLTDDIDNPLTAAAPVYQQDGGGDAPDA